ncbi:hypothetical protein V6Z11_A05G333400 [Gossypium hirsutum]
MEARSRKASFFSANPSVMTKNQAMNSENRVLMTIQWCTNWGDDAGIDLRVDYGTIRGRSHGKRRVC